MTTTYALRLTAPNTFQIAKFSDDFVVEATYNLTRKGIGFSCDCPANYKNKMKPCKHQRMMPYLMGAVNLPRFFDPETGNWHGLMALAPGMAMEHADGEAAISRQGSPETDTEGSSGQLSDRRPYKGSAVASNGQDKELEPATALLPAVSGQSAVPGVTPQSLQAERPKAPAPSAPASNVVTRRI